MVKVSQALTHSATEAVNSLTYFPLALCSWNNEYQSNVTFVVLKFNLALANESTLSVLKFSLRSHQLLENLPPGTSATWILLLYTSFFGNSGNVTLVHKLFVNALLTQWRTVGSRGPGARDSVGPSARV